MILFIRYFYHYEEIYKKSCQKKSEKSSKTEKKFILSVVGRLKSVLNLNTCLRRSWCVNKRATSLIPHEDAWESRPPGGISSNNFFLTIAGLKVPPRNKTEILCNSRVGVKERKSDSQSTSRSIIRLLQRVGRMREMTHLLLSVVCVDRIHALTESNAERRFHVLVWGASGSSGGSDERANLAGVVASPFERRWWSGGRRRGQVVSQRMPASLRGVESGLHDLC